MLSKSSTMLLGLVHNSPLNAYELIKTLDSMHVKDWYNIADSTVYATLKALEKKKYIQGETEKVGNMPDRTVYSITPAGKSELLATLEHSILHFDYDVTIFSIALFFLHAFPHTRQVELLTKRIQLLQKYHEGISTQIAHMGMEKTELSPLSIANVERVQHIVLAEITGAKHFLEIVEKTNQ